MTLDKLTLADIVTGLTDSKDLTMLSFLESKPLAELEDWFRPMFPTTRPERKESSNQTISRSATSKPPIVREATKNNKLANISDEMRLLLEENGLDHILKGKKK